MRILLLSILTLSAMFAGCTDTGESDIRIAFVAKDTALEPHLHPDRLATYITEQTAREASVHFFDDSSAALAALAAGQVDFASVDGAAGWLAWQELGLETIGAEVRGDGRTFYMASAWVRDDSDIQSVEDFAGRDTCHTGATKSAGMFMPMGYLVREGFIDASTYADDISQVQEMARDYFGEATIGGPYAGYEGGLRCLSDGTGEIAFIRDTTPADYCEGDAATDRDWCLDLADYRKILDFGAVPEHPIMVSSHTDDETVQLIGNMLFGMDESAEGQEILTVLFGTGEIRAVDGSEAHLGEYGELISQLPGIEGYAESN
jgi:ABC-type phosphate/phosphonate transport system substrate-binding protein